MDESKKVSVIIPLYNRKHLISRCVESVCRQTYRNLEIIIVDDGSTDACDEVLATLQKSDERINVIRKENGGVSSARNCGLDIATGDYVQFVDSDDALVMDTIELAVSEIEEFELDAVVFHYSCKSAYNCELYPRERERFGMWKSADGIAILAEKGRQCDVWSKLYKRSMIGSNRFPEGVSMGEDFIFNLLYFSSPINISYLKNVCYLYNLESGDSLIKRYDNRGINDLHEQWTAVQPYLKNAEPSSYQLILRYFWCSYMDFVRKLCLLSPLSYIAVVRELKKWGNDEMIRSFPVDCCPKAWDCFFLKKRCFLILPLVIRFARWKARLFS